MIEASTVIRDLVSCAPKWNWLRLKWLLLFRWTEFTYIQFFKDSHAAFKGPELSGGGAVDCKRAPEFGGDPTMIAVKPRADKDGSTYF